MINQLNDSLRVRKANINDLRVIYEFLCDLQCTKFDVYTFNRAFMLNIVKPDNIYLVAEYNSKVVGYLSYNERLLLHHGGRKVGEILEMYVKPEMRSLGVGKLLLDKIKLLSRVMKVQRLELTSDLSREESHKFYVRENFVESHKKFVHDIDLNASENDTEDSD